MTVVRTLIVDDEKLAVARHANLCARIEGVEVVQTQTTNGEVLPAVSLVRPDLVLLDISMPGLDGMALGSALNELPSRPRLVFATAHSDYAVAAFELAAVDYLLKPISLARLQTAIGRVRSTLDQRSLATAYLDTIWLPRGSQMVQFNIAKLELAEAERDYVRLHEAGRSFLVRGTIQALEQRLDPNRFIRAHRSAIVPIANIRSIDATHDGWRILLSSGQRVKVGPSYRAALHSLSRRSPAPGQ